MNVTRIKKEVAVLRETYGTVLFHEDKCRVVIRDFPFPDGWTPQREDYLYVLPPTYPQEHPKPCLRPNMRYKNRRPHIMKKGGPKGLIRHRVNGLNSYWRPDFHTLVTMTRMLKDSLSDPNKCDPWNR